MELLKYYAYAGGGHTTKTIEDVVG